MRRDSEAFGLVTKLKTVLYGGVYFSNLFPRFHLIPSWGYFAPTDIYFSNYYFSDRDRQQLTQIWAPYKFSTVNN